MSGWSPFAPPKQKQQPVPDMPPGRIEELPENPVVVGVDFAHGEDEQVTVVRRGPEVMAVVYGKTLCEQIAKAVMPIVKDKGPVVFARQIGITPNTLNRIVSGVGIKVSTLEALCWEAGWQLHITDAQGQTVALLPQRGDP